MDERLEIRMAGDGGQGVILSSVILADAALRSGKCAAQSQAYGPEARGGVSKGETLIDCRPILYPKVRQANVLLAMTQQALEKYTRDFDEDGVVVCDSSLKPDGVNANVISLPILRTAREKLGKEMCANIVALGALNGVLDAVDWDELEKAVLERVPKGTEELNRRALAEGRRLAAMAG